MKLFLRGPYGVLSCCRGVILARDHGKKEESLKPRHGLETVDWQHTLSGGIRHVLELKIQATDGTFGELVDVCWAPEHTAWFFRSHERKWVPQVSLWGDVRFATDRSHMSLDDLLSRLFPTGMAYPGLTDRRAKMFGSARIAFHEPGVHLAFPMRGIPDELGRLADGKNVCVGSSNQVSPGFRQSGRRGRHSYFCPP